MIAKASIAILFFLFSTTNILAQAAVSVFGSVLDAEGEPVGFAVVRIATDTAKAAHSFEAIGLTDEKGHFTLHGIPQGKRFLLEIQSAGYEPLAKWFEPVVRHRLDILVSMIPSVEYLSEVAITASGMKTESLLASRSVVEIDRGMLDRAQGAAFVNQLERLPGINAISTGVGIAKPMIRGMAFNRVMVNDQGVKQEGQQWGADHGLEIDQYDVAAVEVIKGPASLIYGPDALGGAINIQPAPLPETGQTKAEVLSVYKSNNNLRAFSAGVETNQNNWIFKARYSQQDFDNYRVPATEFNYAGFILPIFDNTLRNTSGMERNFAFTVGTQQDWGKSTVKVSRFHQKVGLFPGAIGIPTSFQLQRFPAKRSIDLPSQDNTHWKVLWNTALMVGHHLLEVDLGYQHNQRRERSLPHTMNVGPNTSGNLAHGFDLHTYTANFRYKTHHSDKWHSVVGWQSQLMENYYSGFEFLLPRFTSGQTGAFFFTEYIPSARLKYNAGLRADYGQHDIEEHLQPIYANLEFTGEYSQRNEDIFRRFGNLSASLGMAWNPSAAWSAKANLGSSYRMPTATELSSNGIHHGTFRHELGNKDLLPERGFQADLEVGFNSRTVTFSASLFTSYYDRYIYLSPTAFFSRLPSGSQITWEFRQAESYFYGGEVALGWQPFMNTQLSLSAEYVSANNLDTKLPLPLIPPFSALLEATQRVISGKKFFRKLELNLTGRHVAAQERTDRNERRTPGYFLMEAGIFNQFSVAGVDLFLNLQVQNLLDRAYLNHLSRYRLLNLPEQGRNFVVSLKIPLNISTKIGSKERKV